MKVFRKAMEPRREIFKYNDEAGMKKFKELTSANTHSKCFEQEDIIKASNKWLKELKNIICSFKKVRIGKGQQIKDEVVEKMKTKHILKSELENVKENMKNGEHTSENVKKKHLLEDKIEEVETILAESSAKKQSDIIIEHFNELSGDNNELSTTKMWNLKKKLCQQNNELPIAM